MNYIIFDLEWNQCGSECEIITEPVCLPGEIIEIGAVKVQNGKEIARFESLVRASEVPENISELTGITSKMLANAPHLPAVLNEFRLFLGDSIFVAHNVGFDYGFISASLDKCGFGVLLNQRLCTINLSRRLIASPKYSLAALKELLDKECSPKDYLITTVGCAIGAHTGRGIVGICFFDADNGKFRKYFEE